MSKLASVRLAPAPDGGKYLLNIQLAATGHLVSGAEGAAGAEGTAAAARVERLERLDAGKQAGSGAPSLRPKGPSLRPAGPLAPPSPKRTGSGAPAAHSSGKVVAKLGTYKYTKPQLIEIGKRCVRNFRCSVRVRWVILNRAFFVQSRGAGESAR